MALLDELKTAVTNGLSAGASAARGQGTALKADFENLVTPNLNAIAEEISVIGQDVVAGNIGADQAKDDIGTQLDRIQSLILASSELALLSAQIIIDAVNNAVKGVLNAATTAACGVAVL